MIGMDIAAVVLGCLGVLFLLLLIVFAGDRSDRELFSLLCILCLCSAGAVVLAGIYEVEDEDFYISDLSADQRCELFIALDSSRWVHDAEITENYQGFSGAYRLTVYARGHDWDHVQEDLDATGIPIYDDFAPALQQLCEGSK